MARMTGYKNPFDGLADAFGRQPNSVGNMHGPAKMLHATTMKPLGNVADTGATKGNPAGLGNPMSGALSGGSTQSQAQHNSVEKAARASAMKRRKI